MIDPQEIHLGKYDPFSPRTNHLTAAQSIGLLISLVILLLALNFLGIAFTPT